MGIIGNAVRDMRSKIIGKTSDAMKNSGGEDKSLPNNGNVGGSAVSGGTVGQAPTTGGLAASVAPSSGAGVSSIGGSAMPLPGVNAPVNNFGGGLAASSYNMLGGARLI